MRKQGFALLMLLALAACGDRVENTGKPMPDQASVEINRQGMEGARKEHRGYGVETDIAKMGAGGGELENDSRS